MEMPRRGTTRIPITRPSATRSALVRRQASAPDTQAGLAALSTRAPIVLALVTDAEPDHVYIGHSLTVFPADITDPTALDGHMIALVGDALASSVPVALPAAFFTRTAGTYAETTALIRSATGHAATPPVWRTGPHTATTANTNSLRTRPAMVMPPGISAYALSQAPADGRYSLLGFYNEFLAAPLASTDAAVVAAITPLEEWWRWPPPATPPPPRR